MAAPVLFRLGPLLLPAFGAVLAAGLLLALALSLRTARWAGIAPDQLWRANLFLLGAAFSISRVLLAAEHPRILARYPVFLLLQPALTAPGVALAALATVGWLWRERLPLRRVAEAWTAPGLLLWAALAWGHALEGSDPGMPTHAPWAVHPPGCSGAEQPVALLVALAALVLCGLALWLQGRNRPATGWCLVGAGLLQAAAGFLRQPGPTAVGGLEPLAWVALGIVATGALWLIGTPKRLGSP